jgi:hypothetical protein
MVFFTFKKWFAENLDSLWPNTQGSQNVNDFSQHLNTHGGISSWGDYFPPLWLT